MNSYDVDGDGTITSTDLIKSEKMLEIELREEKARSHKQMAWVAMLSMVGITIAVFAPNFLSESRIGTLEEIIGTFFIAQASIVGFYFGANAFMSKGSSQMSR